MGPGRSILATCRAAGRGLVWAARPMLLAAELGVLTLLVIGAVYGQFDQGIEFFVYVLGLLGALSIGAVVALPPRITGKILIHGALVIGCVVFSFPFVWLVSTSFKYREEIGAYPPRWMPSMPGAVVRSPYVTEESLEPVRRPPGLSAERWRRLWPPLEAALWSKGRAMLGDLGASAGADDAVLRPAMVRGLWHAAWQGVDRKVWEAEDGRLIRAVTDRIDPARVDEVWDTISRGVVLRDPVVTEVNLVEHRLTPGGSFLDRWASLSGDAARLSLRPASRGGKPSAALAYDFTGTDRVAVSAELPLPVRPEDFLSVTLPIRQDRSWHAMTVQVEVDGKRYVPEDAFYLGERRWQEITFQLGSRSPRDERSMGIWPLVETQSDGALAAPGRFRLTLVLERASAAGAAWRKYTSSFRLAYIATEHRWNYIGNSFLLVALNVIGQVLSCSLVAYAFARLRWPGRDVLFTVMLATMMLPPQVTMIPEFVIFQHLGWYNTLQALWVPSLFGSAFFIFMLRQFMRGIPRDLEDAAKIDGCGFFQVYWRIILPLMKPALAAVAVFTFMGTWNNFMGPLIYLNDQRLYPLALGLFDFRTQHGGDYGLLMAASTMVALPVILVFFVAQKYFIQGVTLTGMKG